LSSKIFVQNQSHPAPTLNPHPERFSWVYRAKIETKGKMKRARLFLRVIAIALTGINASFNRYKPLAFRCYVAHPRDINRDGPIADAVMAHIRAPTQPLEALGGFLVFWRLGRDRRPFGRLARTPAMS
jgi:hypothetical protein